MVTVGPDRGNLNGPSKNQQIRISHSLLVSWEVEGGWGVVGMVVLFTVREIFVLLAVIRLCLQCRFLYTKPALKKKRHYLLKQKRNFLFVVFENTFSTAAKLIAI